MTDQIVGMNEKFTVYSKVLNYGKVLSCQYYNYLVMTCFLDFRCNDLSYYFIITFIIKLHFILLYFYFPPFPNLKYVFNFSKTLNIKNYNLKNIYREYIHHQVKEGWTAREQKKKWHTQIYFLWLIILKRYCNIHFIFYVSVPTLCHFAVLISGKYKLRF